MNYCLNYNKDTEHLKCIKEVNEWTIEYNDKDTTLLEFLELNKDKRINLYYKYNKIDFLFLEKLCEKYSNLYIKFSFSLYEEVNKIKPNIKYFYDIKINNWDTFLGIIKNNVTDIYIVEDLGFELDKISYFSHAMNVKIRVYPNIAQSQWEDTPALKKFFIRPEDLEFYSKYIDTIEFYNVDKKLDIYYKIYSKDKKWLGKLNEIILNFNSEIDNKYIIPRFVEKRISCNKKCLKGGKCKKCDNIELLSKSLEKNNLIVKILNDRKENKNE